MDWSALLTSAVGALVGDPLGILLKSGIEHPDKYEQGADWRSLAYWIHDHLPYRQLQFFFAKLCAFNNQLAREPAKTIYSFINPRATYSGKGHQRRGSTPPSTRISLC